MSLLDLIEQENELLDYERALREGPEDYDEMDLDELIYHGLVPEEVADCEGVRLTHGRPQGAHADHRRLIF